MAFNPVLLAAETQLTASAAAVITAPANTHYLIRTAVVTNTDTVQRTVTLYRVPNGGSALAANEVLAAFPLSPAGMPGHTYVVNELSNMILNPGDMVQALADSANKVNFTASGFQF